MRLAIALCWPLLALAAPPRLVEWERGVALEPPEDPAMTMYLWFYEWNMFEAMAPGPHTHGTYKLDRRIGANGARITSPAIDFRVKPAPDGAEMVLTIKNVTAHEWPEIAAIIPCWSPGQVQGTNPNSPLPKTAAFADRSRDGTQFLSGTGVATLTNRAIHFNSALRGAVDKVSDNGTHAFSYKWPTSEENAHAGVLVRRSADGKWVTGIGWEDYLSVQGHNPWSCLHVAIRVGPLTPNGSKTVRGRLYLFQGSTEECWRRARRDLRIDAKQGARTDRPRCRRNRRCSGQCAGPHARPLDVLLTQTLSDSTLSYVLFSTRGTAISYVMNAKMPSRVAAPGGWCRRKDSRDVPDGRRPLRDPKALRAEVPSRWTPSLRDGAREYHQTGPGAAFLHLGRWLACLRARQPYRTPQPAIARPPART